MLPEQWFLCTGRRCILYLVIQRRRLTGCKNKFAIICFGTGLDHSARDEARDKRRMAVLNRI